MGGNLCNGSPAADSVPALIVAGAKASIVGPKGRRELAVEDVMLAPRKLCLTKGEIVASFLLPAKPARTSDAYLRFIPRTEMDIAVVGCGVCLTLDAGGECTAARVALGAVAPRPLLVRRCGQGADRHKGRRCRAPEARCSGARGVPTHRRQARHQGISHQGRGRARAPGGAHCTRKGEERLMAKHHVATTVNGDAVEFLAPASEKRNHAPSRRSQ